MKDREVSDNVGELYLDRRYHSLDRWVSYFYQVKLLLAVPGVEEKRILEIGIGNKFTYRNLKMFDLNISTCDINEKLLPDCVADVEKLPYKDNSFGAIICYEVLEHLSFAKLKCALEELRRVTSSYAIISLPYSGFCFSGYLKPPFSKGFIFRVPMLIYRPKSLIKKFNIGHHWTLGEIKSGLTKVRKLIAEAGFKINREIVPPLNSHHQFWVLEIAD